MTAVPLAVVRWAAQECEWQGSGERSVPWMIDGWLYARRYRSGRPTVATIVRIGALVEPRHNRLGLRTVGVRVGYDVKMHPSLVPAALRALVASEGLSPAEWFRQYEEIHPFRDGNGRTGNILFNWLSGSLLAPAMPPNLWHDPRRDVAS